MNGQRLSREDVAVKKEVTCLLMNLNFSHGHWAFYIDKYCIFSLLSMRYLKLLF
jgi:hypothetical protein